MRFSTILLAAWILPAAGVRKRSTSEEEDTSDQSARVRFEDKSSDYRIGLDGTSFGVAFADIDGDGDTDIFVTNSENSNKLYLNSGGVFADATDGSGLAVSKAKSRGVAFADVDDDGHLDVFISAYAGDSNLLFMGDGTGRFTDVSVQAGVADMGSGQGVCFADVDGDGDLDLFVANFGESDKFYLNDGRGIFSDVTRQAGLESDGVNGFGCSFGDVDGDGDEDLYVNNDGVLSKLYINDGAGVFTDVTEQANAGGNTGGGRGVQMADFNGDGHLDIASVSALGGNVFLLSNGDGTFTDKSSDSGINSHWGTPQGMQVADFDGDGDLDILIAVLNTPHAVYENDGTGRFRDVQIGAGAGSNRFGQGIAFGDLNNDGSLDAMIASWGRFFPLCPFCSARNNLLINQNTQPAWLKVRPLGNKGFPTLLGAQVRVFEAGTRKPAAAMARIDGGGGFCSQNAYEAYFGLSTAVSGGATTFDVEVRCGGSWIARTGVAPNQLLDVPCTN